MNSFNDLFNNLDLDIIDKIKYLIDLVTNELNEIYNSSVSFEVIDSYNYLFNDVNHGRLYDTLNNNTFSKIKENVLLSIELIIRKMIFETTKGMYIDKNNDYIEIFYNNYLKELSKNEDFFWYEILYTIYHEFYHHLMFRKIINNKDIKFIIELENYLISNDNILNMININNSKMLSELSANSFASIKCNEFLTKNHISFNKRYAYNKIENDKLKLVNYDLTSLIDCLNIKSISKNLIDYNNCLFSIFINKDGTLNSPIEIINNANNNNITDMITNSIIGSSMYINYIIDNKIKLSEEDNKIILYAIDNLVLDFRYKQKYNTLYLSSLTPNKEELEFIKYNENRIKELLKLKEKYIKYITKYKVKKK